MSTISNIIFNNKEHYITSPYGRRKVFSTSAGNTYPFHYGTDYGTDGKKLPQYAIEEGSILSCGKADDGALYIWVKYPRINKKMLHYHLSSIKVKKGQKVKKGTLLGYTGMTGRATGIHLHLGIKDLSTDRYEDPEAFAKKYSPFTGYRTGLYKVDAYVLHVRRGPSTAYPYLKYKQMTANAQRQVSDLNGKKAVNGLVRGCLCTVTRINGCWGKIPSGWICLKYCTLKVAD